MSLILFILYVYYLLQTNNSENKSGTLKMKANLNKTIEKSRSSSIRKRNAHLLLSFFFKLYKAIHRLEGNTALGVR